MSTRTTWSGTVLTRDLDRIRILTLDHPDRNLLNPGVMSELRERLLLADADPAVHGVILTGAGAAFCGGLDVPAIQGGADPVEFARKLVDLLAVFPRLGTPIAAAVNGDAVASGASLVAACDFGVAVPDCRIGTYQVSVGIWPMIAQVPLVRRLGARAAMENVGCGEPFTAARAREVGLVQRVAPAGEILGLVTAWLTHASRAAAVAAAGRRSLYELAELPYAEALEETYTRIRLHRPGKWPL